MGELVGGIPTGIREDAVGVVEDWYEAGVGSTSSSFPLLLTTNHLEPSLNSFIGRAMPPSLRGTCARDVTLDLLLDGEAG